jgi:hypothetical protein
MPLKKIKRAFRGARKAVKKIIPKEIRPFLPYVAAAIPGAQGLASLNAFMGPAAQKALLAASTRFATDDEADLKDLGITATLAAAPDLISSGTGKLAKGEGRLAEFLNKTKTLEDGKKTASLAKTISSAANPETLGGQAKLVGSLGTLDAATKLKEIEQDQIDAYNRKLMEDGIRSKAERRAAIRNIYTGIGYDEDYVDSMLDRFGYRKGGGVMAAASMSGFGKKYQDYLKKKKEKRVKKAGGGISEAAGPIVAQLIANGMDYEDAIELVKEEFPEDTTELDILKKRAEREDVEEISDYADLAEEGFKSALGVESLFPQAPKPMGITPGFGNLPRMADGGDVMSPEEYFKEKGKFKKRKDIDDMMREYEEYLYKQKYGPRDSAAEGGLMNLGGNEMDLRGGGFVPIGKKEKADDVPARLSKNEFVMTADAVRGAGGGDVNEGARRMYQTMDKLEAMA